MRLGTSESNARQRDGGEFAGLESSLSRRGRKMDRAEREASEEMGS